MIKLTIFNQIRFLSEYSKDYKLIFSRIDKKYYKVILGGSNPKDWIIFDEFSLKG